MRALTRFCALLPIIAACSLEALGSDREAKVASDVRKMTGREKERFLEEVRKGGDKALQRDWGTLLEIAASVVADGKWHHLEEHVSELIGENVRFFPDSLLIELERKEKTSPLRLMGACCVLYQNKKKLDEGTRERIWELIPNLRKNESAAVRWATLRLVFLYAKSKDTFPIFLDALDDMGIAEGDRTPVAMYAIGGIEVSGKCSEACVSKVIAFLDSPNETLRDIAARDLPLIVMGNEKLRARVLDVYREQLVSGKRHVASMLTYYERLLPDPEQAAEILKKVYKTNSPARSAVLHAVRQVKGIQPHVEAFLVNELSAKDRSIRDSVVRTLGSYPRLKGETTTALRKARENEDDAVVRIHIEQILRRLEDK